MKLGLESRNKTIAAGVLLLVALGLFVNWLIGSSSSGPTASPVVSAAPTGPLVRTKLGKGKSKTLTRSLDPTLRYDWLANSEDAKYAGNGRNIFADQAEIPTPIASAKKAPVDNTPPPPPPPPPINLKFFGFANKPGELKKIFLAEGEDVFIAREGDIVDRRYKVIHITPTAVEIEDVLNNNRQSIPLTQA